MSTAMRSYDLGDSINSTICTSAHADVRGAP